MMDERYLEHHGIKGQKWGVKHGPPYPLKEKKGVQNKSEGTERKWWDRASVGAAGIAAASTAANVASMSVGVIFPQLAIASITSIAATPALAVAEFVGNQKSKKLVDLLKKESEDETVDRETGLLKKKNEMSIEEDAKRINPMYTSTKYKADNNCALCSVTYDLRRRGFDVSANLSKEGYTDSEIGKIYKNSKYSDLYGNASYLSGSMVKSERDRFISDLSSQKVGSRGIVTISWAQTLSGHMIAYEVTNDGLKFIDAQNGNVYDQSTFNSSYAYRASNLKYMRTDNCELNTKELENVTRNYART